MQDAVKELAVEGTSAKAVRVGEAVDGVSHGPPDAEPTGSAPVQPAPPEQRRSLGWVIAGVLLSIAGVAWGIATKNAALMAVGFMCFAVALGCSDGPIDRYNDDAADALRSRDREVA